MGINPPAISRSPPGSLPQTPGFRKGANRSVVRLVGDSCFLKQTGATIDSITFLAACQPSATWHSPPVR